MKVCQDTKLIKKNIYNDFPLSIDQNLNWFSGMQAVMASDFTMSRFKFLEKLILIHGFWSYDRLARMILYFFYKNAVGATFIKLIICMKTPMALHEMVQSVCVRCFYVCFYIDFSLLNQTGVCVSRVLVSNLLWLFWTSDD